MSIECQHDIVELKISVDDAILVKVLESQAHFSSVESVITSVSTVLSFVDIDLLRPLCAKLSSLDMQHEITTTNVLHHKVDPGFRLETRVKTQKKRMLFLVRDEKNSLFRTSALYFVVLDDEFFLQNFDGVQLLRSLGLCQHDLTKVTLTQHSKKVKVVETDTNSARRWCLTSSFTG